MKIIKKARRIIAPLLVAVMLLSPCGLSSAVHAGQSYTIRVGETANIRFAYPGTITQQWWGNDSSIARIVSGEYTNTCTVIGVSPGQTAIKTQVTFPQQSYAYGETFTITQYTQDSSIINVVAADGTSGAAGNQAGISTISTASSRMVGDIVVEGTKPSMNVGDGGRVSDFDDILSDKYYDGLAPAIKDGRLGFIDNHFRVVIPFMFMPDPPKAALSSGIPFNQFTYGIGKAVLYVPGEDGRKLSRTIYFDKTGREIKFEGYDSSSRYINSVSTNGKYLMVYLFPARTGGLQDKLLYDMSGNLLHGIIDEFSAFYGFPGIEGGWIWRENELKADPWNPSELPDTPQPVSTPAPAPIPTPAPTPTPTPNPSNGSSAGASSWAISSINEAISLGIVPDYLLSNYQSGISRREFCEMVVRMLMAKCGTVSNEDVFISHFRIDLNENPFDDTTDRYVKIANALKIVSGIGNRMFAPNNMITRQEAAAMLTRAAEVFEFTAYAPAPTDFTDKGAVAVWAAAAVDFVSANGIMSGTGSNMFSPHTSYTREQSVVTMLRLFKAFPRDYYSISGGGTSGITPTSTTTPAPTSTPTETPSETSTTIPEPEPKPEISQVTNKSYTYSDPYMSGASGSYTGDWKNGKPNGKGTLVFDKKYSAMGYPTKYTGDWVDGNKHGEGTATWSDGSYYTGSFVKNKKQGWGKMTYSDGTYFEGAWVNDKPDK